MSTREGSALSWTIDGAVMEVSLHRAPANEIGTAMLEDLERLFDSVRLFEREGAAIVLHSALPAGFSAGADFRELFARMPALDPPKRVAAVPDFLRRIHRVLDALDERADRG
jgi:enoyl-CoA hydratase/carnithine racemase